MIVFTTYHEIKRLDQARRARSLARYELQRHLEEARHQPPPARVEAEVIELAFGAQCEQQMGA
jgi:hypothetical protein